MLNLEIPEEMNISDAWVMAYKKAIIEETDVSFVFNDTTYTTNPEGARQDLSKISLDSYIDGLCEREKEAVDQITKLRHRIREIRQFAEKHLGVTIPRKIFANPKTP